MFELVFSVLTGFFAVIGLVSAYLAIYDALRTGRDERKTDITLTVTLCPGDDLDQLAGTADYIRMRYFPAMRVWLDAADLSDDDRKRAGILADKYAFSLERPTDGEK